MATTLLDLDKNTPIISMKVFEGLLIFCDNKRSEPHKINIERSMSNLTNYYEDEDSVKLIRKPPAELQVQGQVISGESNFLENEAYQFAARYEYEDGEISSISSYSETPVQIEDIGEAGSLDDGATGFTVSGSQVISGSGGNKNLILGRTTDGFQTVDRRFISFPQFDLLGQSTGVDVNGDGTRIVVTTERVLAIIDYTNPNSPSLIRAFRTRDAGIDSGNNGLFIGAAISRDGNTIIFATQDQGTEDLYIFKAPVDIANLSQNPQRVTETGSNLSFGRGTKVALSAGGNIAYACGDNNVLRSDNFGNLGSWRDVFQATGSIPGLEGENAITAICCSADGQIAYALANAERDYFGNEAYVFRTRNSGADWDLAYSNTNINSNPREISCSSDGRYVSFITENQIWVSQNSGSTFRRMATNMTTSNLAGVSVSTTGRRVVVSGVDSVTTGLGVSLYTSMDFGLNFTKRVNDNLKGDAGALVMLTSINNESGIIGSRGLNNINNSYNQINITYNTGDKHVTHIDLLLRVVKTGRMFRITRINKAEQGIGNNQNRTFSFRNDGNYVAVAQRDVTKLFDNVPLRARCFDIVQNTIIFGNYVDGRGLVRSNGDPLIANASIRVVRNTLSANGFIGSLKSGSLQEYGQIYLDDHNRSSSVLRLGTLNVPNIGNTSNVDTAKIRSHAVINLSHTAPSWAKKFKFVRKPLNINYDIINGFDNAYFVNGEIFLEITSYTGVVPRPGDILELFSEINTETGGSAQRISQGRLTVPILRYVDELATGRQEVAVQLSSGDTSVRVDSQSQDDASPVPRGRYIVINNQDLENYTGDSVTSGTSRYLNSLFYINQRSNIEDEVLFQEIPGEYEIQTGGLHGGGQSANASGVFTLSNDYDVLWGSMPPREIYKYDLNTVLSNLGRPNAISENAREEDRLASMIASEPYVADTDFNGLSSFNLGLIPFKDLDKEDGPIQFVNAEDTNVEVYQEDKTSRVLYKKNVLTTATGDRQVTQTEDIWGEQIRSIQEYGMSHPESYAEWGGHRYYVDAKRGVVLRKGGDGQTEVSSYGLLDFFHDILGRNKNNVIRGYYEPKYNNYVVVIGTDDHISFAERNNGWEHRYSFFPDRVVNDGLDVYSFKDGFFYKHDADENNYNTFYGNTANTTVKIFFNDANDMVKTVNALMVNGDRPNRIVINTEDQQNTVTSFENVEGLEYAPVGPNQNDSGKDIEVIGNATEAMVDAGNTTIRISFSNANTRYVHVGDTILKFGNPIVSLGECTTLTSDSVTVRGTGTVNSGDTILARNDAFNGDEMKGRVIGCEVTYENPTTRKVLNSIQIEVDESKQ